MRLRTATRGGSLALAAMAVMVCGPSVAAPGAAAVPAHRPVVTGYLLDDARDALVDRSARRIGTVGVDGVGLTRSGAWVRRPSAGARRLVRRAHHDGLRAELLVSNFDDAIGDFSPALGAGLLRDDAHVARVAHRLAGFARGQGWDGVTIDLESLRRADGPGLTRFVRALQADLPSARTVSVDLMAATDTSGYRAMGYRLRGLSRAADVLAVMAYDEHGPGWSGPGPIGALPWQRHALKALRAVVPARRIDLGVAGYGYTWPRSDPASGRVVSPRRARALVADAGVHAHWHARQGEWSARLPDGTAMWWSDGRSVRLREQLARSHGLHGVALWRLGLADPLPD